MSETINTFSEDSMRRIGRVVRASEHVARDERGEKRNYGPYQEESGDDSGNIEIVATDPTSPQDGSTWINSTSKVLKYKTGGTVSYIGVHRGTPASPQDGDLYVVAAS